MAGKVSILQPLGNCADLMKTPKTYLAISIALLPKLKDHSLFEGSVASLRRFLPQIDFTLKKRTPRKGLMEDSDVSTKLIRFLRIYVEHKNYGLLELISLSRRDLDIRGCDNLYSWQNNDARYVKTNVDR